MELTIEQLPQQGVAAHEEGDLRKAERLFPIFLQTQPLHPDANNNLGILAVPFDQVDVSLPLLKIALEANPKIEQFWLSYIKLLVRQQQFEEARVVFEQAKKAGLSEDKIDTLEK